MLRKGEAEVATAAVALLQEEHELVETSAMTAVATSDR
jgi:hypothetical protein